MLKVDFMWTKPSEVPYTTTFCEGAPFFISPLPLNHPEFRRWCFNFLFFYSDGKFLLFSRYFILENVWNMMTFAEKTNKIFWVQENKDFMSEF